MHSSPRSMDTAARGARHCLTLPRIAPLALAALLVSGCSVLQEEKIDYKSARPGKSLEVPPDLSQLARDQRYQVPGAEVTASGFQNAQPVGNANTATNQVGQVRIERSGSARWLVVDQRPDQLWGPVKDFWQENGFVLVQDQEALGVMETDWAENRAKIPQDFIRSSIGRLFDSLYSSSERDRFRTRLERRADGGTEIYITHKGMMEVYTSNQKDQTVWQPRPSEPELETEFLRRMMVKLGASEAQAKAAVATAPAAPATAVSVVGGVPTIALDDDFDRAWRRVGLALDRSGFTVEDRDRSQGVYFVRFVPADAGPDGKAKPGFFGRLFGGGSDAPAKPVQQRVNVRATGATTVVTVQDAKGQPLAGADAQRMLERVAASLK